MRSKVREITVTAHIDAPPEAVFSAIADPRKPFLTSNPFTTMSVVGEQTAGVGTVYRWKFALPFGLTFQFDEVVTDWVEPELFVYRAVSGLQMQAVNAFAPAGGGTDITFALSYRFPGFWRWLIPRSLVRLGLRRAFANLRRRVEPKDPSADGRRVRLMEYAMDLAAPPAKVFRVVGDPRSKLVWVPAIKRVEMLSEHPPGPGSRYLASSGVGNLEFIFREEIVDWRPPHRLAYGGKSSWGRFLAIWKIEPTPRGSRAFYRMDYWFPGGRLGRAAGRVAAAIVGPPMSRLSAAKVKEAVEEHKWVQR